MTYIVAGLQVRRDSAGPPRAVCDELCGCPFAVGVTTSVNLEPFGAGCLELGAVTIAGRHVSADRA